MRQKKYYKLIRVDYSDSQYFHITNLENETGSFVFQKRGSQQEPTTMQYSTDGVNWTNYDYSNYPTVTVPAKGNIYFRGTGGGNGYVADRYIKFHFDKQYKISGNLLSVIDYNNMNSITTIGGASGKEHFNSFFINETNLISCSGLSFGSLTTLDICAFYYTFSGCTSLTDTPDFTGITDGSGNNALSYCFNGCSSLVLGADLSGFTTLKAPGIYSGCSKLQTAIAPNVSTWSTNDMNNWLQNAGTQATGTKTVSCPTGVTITTGSNSGIPTGWTRVDY